MPTASLRRPHARVPSKSAADPWFRVVMSLSRASAQLAADIEPREPSTTVVTRCLSGHRATECLPTLLGVILGDGLVLPTPLRPGQNVADRLGYGQHESPPQPPPLGHAPWEARPRLALNAASGLACGGDCRLFWHMSTAIVPARIMVSRANAPMASVRCRYQAVQLRTSS